MSNLKKNIKQYLNNKKLYCFILPPYFKDINTMINKKNLFVTVIIAGVYFVTYCSSKIKALEAVEVFSPLVRPLYLQIYQDIKCLKGESFLEAHLNQRLFYGPSGNGKRLVAQYYAKEANGILIEHSSSEIVSGYRKEGSLFLTNLIRNAIARAKKDNKIAIIYIYDIDEVEEPIDREQRFSHEMAMMDQRRALEMFRRESAKHNTENSNVFIIFSAHDRSNVYEPFLARINGPSINFPNPNYHAFVSIFNKYFLEQDIKAQLKSRLSPEAVAEFQNEIDEIANQELSLSKLDKSFWEKKGINDSSWLDREDFMQTKKAAYDLSMTLSDLCNKLAQKFSEESKEGNSNKRHFIIQKELYSTMSRSYANLAFIYDKHDLFTKVYKRYSYYSGLRVEQLAKKIIKYAIYTNKGFVSEQIMKEFV
jgi:hypothetical protein